MKRRRPIDRLPLEIRSFGKTSHGMGGKPFRVAARSFRTRHETFRGRSCLTKKSIREVHS
jgi:hypothetical protein